MNSQQQLTLNVQLRDDATLENYLSEPSGQVLLEALKGQLATSGEPIIYLYGQTDTGKSHLLQAACHLAGAAPSLYLPLAELSEYPPEEVLQGIDSMALVCLDDIQAVLGNEAWEIALFHFFNRAREKGCRLLVSSNAAPRALDITLADLQSRLSWGIVYQLGAVDDERRKSILCFRADRRGLVLSKDVANYIFDRAPRSLAPLVELLNTLDSSSLIEQRALTIPFVKKALGW
jgi:DnaA family protein